LSQRRRGRYLRLTVSGFLAVAMVCACAEHKAVDLVSPSFSSRVPNRVAVLPMDNMSTDLDATPLIRPIVQERMIYRGYNCLPLEQVDEVLKEKGVMVSHDVYMFRPQELGQMLGVDAVVYGTVDEFNKHYAVLFADIIVGLKLAMVDTMSGDTLWRSEHSASQNTALNTLLVALQYYDKPADALAAAAAYNAAFAVLSAYRPYAEEAAAQAMASLPPGPMGARPYPWDLNQRALDNDPVLLFMGKSSSITTYSPRSPAGSRQKVQPETAPRQMAPGPPGKGQPRENIIIKREPAYDRPQDRNSQQPTPLPVPNPERVEQRKKARAKQGEKQEPGN